MAGWVVTGVTFCDGIDGIVYLESTTDEHKVDEMCHDAQRACIEDLRDEMWLRTMGETEWSNTTDYVGWSETMRFEVRVKWEENVGAHCSPE